MLRLSRVPGIEALIKPLLGSLFSDTNERRKMCKRETLLINFKNKWAVHRPGNFLGADKPPAPVADELRQSPVGHDVAPVTRSMAAVPDTPVVLPDL